MQLNEFQKRFRDTMLDQPEALKALPDDISSLFAVGDIPLPDRLTVYRNNIVGGLTETLVGSFPVLEKLVGTPFLEGMARSFVLEHPPQEGCLNTYGQGFDDFIADFELAKGLPYLPDIARLELAMSDAYLARDDAPLTAEDLSEIAPEDLADLRLQLRYCVRLVSSRFPIDAIRSYALAEEQDAPLDINTGGVFLIVHRPELEPTLMEAEICEFSMLTALGRGMVLGEALEATMQKHESFDFQAFLQKHLSLETFMAL